MRDSQRIYEKRAENEQFLFFHAEPKLLQFAEDLTDEERQILENPKEYPTLYEQLVRRLQYTALKRESEV